jgi:CRISPR/Cas system-associated exonuclease Cas4 (RecB family)
MNKLYKPEIVKKVIDDTHYYYVDGVFKPSVTKILQEAMPMPFALRQWIGEVGNDKAKEKLEKAGERGTAIHNACEDLLRGIEIDLTQFPLESDKKCLVAFKNWCAEYQPEVVEIEKTLASQSGYAGTLDILCKIKGQLTIVDIKTSSAVYDEHLLQITAYMKALQEMTGEFADRMILHLNPRTKTGYVVWTEKDMKLEDKPVTDKDFLLVFEMYKMLNGGKIPSPKEVMEYPTTLKL